MPLPAAVPDAVRRLADAVDTGSTDAGPLDLPAPEGPAARAVDHAVRHAADLVTSKNTDPHRAFDTDRLGRPAVLRVRAFRAARNVVLSGTSWRYGLRLALCIGLAQILVSTVPVPRSYWVALTITFVLKPDFGSVFSRAVQRALGTAVGLVLATVVLAEVPAGGGTCPC